MIVDNELLLCGIFSIDELCDFRVGGGSGGGKMKREMNTALSKCQVLPRHTLLTRLLNHSFMCTALVSMTIECFELGIGAVLSEM